MVNISHCELVQRQKIAGQMFQCQGVARAIDVSRPVSVESIFPGEYDAFTPSWFVNHEFSSVRAILPGYLTNYEGSMKKMHTCHY